jgi:predicted nucleotidyltransferase component of viral defense system
LEIVNDEYGRESYQARVYYRGPLRWGGPPRAIQLDVSRDEWLAFPPATRLLLHPYSDAARLAEPTIPCHALAEMLAEKLRAISGQRRFAISRDLYDIYRFAGMGIAMDSVRTALPAKFAAKGLSAAAISVECLAAQRELFQRDWDRRLAHLLPAGQLAPFNQVWDAVLPLIAALERQTPSG